ncbi:unnamed protein product [Allacma fusca]|uniref:Uncharacterized protein n=1 Tax=Allacma fusca TaxID=39272 RepID=A0A8J2JC69_9HEXA|nr:unnamed protein product [Allacma fusca]
MRFNFGLATLVSIHPAKEVEEVAAAIRERGGSAQLVKFEGSDHVLHYKMYPTEYVSAITKFIDETMESNIGPAIYWDE